MNRLARCVLAGLFAVNANVAHSALQFTDWTSNTATSAAGTVGAITVSLSGPVQSAVLNGISPFFSSAALFTPALASSDYIEILVSPPSKTFTLTFSQAVTDPLMHVNSLASVFTFAGINPVKVSGNTHFAVSGNTVTGDNAQGQSNGTLRLPGTFTSISFSGSYVGNDGILIQVGFDPLLAVPEPHMAALWMVGLAGVAFAARRRRR